MDYGTFFSTACLLNGVFVGLFLAAMIGGDSPLGHRPTYLIAIAWFTPGCFFPLTLLADKHGIHSFGWVVAIQAVTFIFFSAVAAIVLFAGLKLPFPGTRRFVMRYLRNETARLQASIAKREAELAEGDAKLRALRKENHQLLRKLVDSGEIRTWPELSRAAKRSHRLAGRKD